MEKREQWGSRIGLILAMAGNAIGLGNFLRFPVQAAQNGGGIFMIPYFVAFCLLAVPLMWVEWGIGRHGGQYKHGSLPGMFDSMWKHPISKYLGVLGLFVSSVIMVYYTYIESWTLGFSFFSVAKTYFGFDSLKSMSGFLGSYTGVSEGFFSSTWVAYGFLLITLFLNFWILMRGITEGIEKFVKFAMPALFIFGIFLVILVFTVGTPDPVKHPDWSVAAGFAYIWNPRFEMLADSKIWLAAAGQIFFTLSVGMGTLHAYSSYLRPKDDIALSGLATASLNEYAEVILGGTIAIPIAVAFFGIQGTEEIAKGGAFNLGFVSLPVIIQKLPMGSIVGFLWFFLLFFAGITSSIAMCQPLISFIKEQFGLSHKKAVILIASIIFVLVHFVVLYNKFGFLDEMDYWAGTFSLVIVALAEVVIFAWIFGIDKGMKELNKGGDIKIPNFFKFVIKYITPAYLLIILGFWVVQGALPTLMMEGVDPVQVPYRWGARILMILMFTALILMVKVAWKRNSNTFEYNQKKGD